MVVQEKMYILFFCLFALLFQMFVFTNFGHTFSVYFYQEFCFQGTSLQQLSSSDRQFYMIDPDAPAETFNYRETSGSPFVDALQVLSWALLSLITFGRLDFKSFFFF